MARSTLFQYASLSVVVLLASPLSADEAPAENLSLVQVVAIGDGANDIPMLLKAGLGIAIHAKEKVQKKAKYRINFGPMTFALSYMNNETL